MTDSPEAPATLSEEALDALAIHIRTSHFVLIAACFTLAALVATAEPNRRYLRAQEDLEGIKRAIGASGPLDPTSYGGGFNLKAKEFLESSLSDDIRPGDPFVEKDCVSLEPSDSLLNLLAPYLAREFPQPSGYEPDVVVDDSGQAFLIDLPPAPGAHLLQRSPADLATWFYVWEGLLDPLPALRLLPKSLSWFELEDLAPPLRSQLSQAFSLPQYMGSNEHVASHWAKIDLVSVIDNGKTLPTDLVIMPAPDRRCLSILADSFYLVQLQQISGNSWRAIFVLGDGGLGGPSGNSFVLDRIAVFDANLEQSSIALGWQGKVAEQASTTWKPGRSAESFPELVELTQGIDSMRIGQVARFLDNLERQAAASEGRVSVASVDLPAQLAATWGIGIVLIIQLYLHLHVLRLKELTWGAQLPPSPWIGLYPGSFSRLAAALSICIPPFACIVGIVIAAIRNGIPEGWMVTAGFYLSPFASLALGLLTAVVVSQMGRRHAARASCERRGMFGGNTYGERS